MELFEKATKKEPNFTSSDPYEQLGLPPKATLSQVKQVYFALVREYSPENDPEKFKIIRSAYELLRNPEKKAAADLFRFQEPSSNWKSKKNRKDLVFALGTDDFIELLSLFAEEGEATTYFRPINKK